MSLAQPTNAPTSISLISSHPTSGTIVLLPESSGSAGAVTLSQPPPLTRSNAGGTLTLPTTSALATVLGLTANQIDLIVKSILELLDGSTGTSILTKIPKAVLTTYQTVAKFANTTDVNTQQQMVLNLLVQGIEKLGLPEQDIELLEPVLTNLVPALIAQLPVVEAGVYKLIQEVEVEAQTCWGKFCAIL
jgi:hypothetical protein